MFIDVQFRKESHQNAFHIIDSEMFIWQRSNQAFFSLLFQACFSHQHPAWHIVDCQQIHFNVLESLDTILESRDVVCDGACSRQRTSRGFHPSFVVVAVQALFQPWSSRLQTSTVSVGFSFRAVGNSSWSVIARPTRRCCSLESANQSRCN